MPLLLRLICCLLVCCGGLRSARAQVVINEIMYRPGTGFPENTGLEFIEFCNPTAGPVDMGGWAITSGTAFTFPAGTVIAAGGFLVVAANPGLVQSTYGVSGVLGPWAAGSTLANSGEKIALSRPGAVAGTTESVDAVTYASEGDWAVRVRETTFGGWDWSTAANGGGKSLELRNAALSNDNGQNWAPSTAAGGATPGAANSVMSNNVAPIISEVKHAPAVPKSTESVTISCEVTDEAAPQYLAATLFWRVATTASPGAFQALPMTGDGLGRFSAVLGAKANLTVVEFYLAVNDGVATRTWPAPTSEGQNANCQYQVTNEVLSTTEDYYFLILTGAENSAYNTLAPSDSPSNKLDRQFNTTLVVSNGTDTSIRYRSSIRFRGNSSRSYQFKPLRVAVPGDAPLGGTTGFNLNPKSSFLQFLGMRMFQLAGLRAPDSFPVKPRRNGVEYTSSISTTPDYGRWVREEDVGGDFVSNHWPEANGGGIYKKTRPDRFWRSSGWTVPATPSGTLDGWSKQNNSAANDWTDLTGFFTTVQSAAAPHFPSAPATDVAQSGGVAVTGNGFWNNTAYSTAEIAALETAADLDQWARWFAVMTILQDLETNISNGEDDDYGIYFAPNLAGQRRANLVTHDMDVILGVGDTPAAYNAIGLYDMTETGSVFRPLLPLFGTTGVAGNAAFRTKYRDAIRQLYGSVFNASTVGNPNPAFYQFLDSHLTGWVPTATISAMKTWMTNRQAYLLGLVGSGAVAPAAATSTAFLVNTPGALMIHEVLANNVAAHANGAGFPDVIELYNAGASPLDLTGKSLTDDAAVKAKYVFPAGTMIAADGYLTVYADTDLAAPGLHAGFGLDAQGDGVFLYDSVAGGQAHLDSIAFGNQPPDYSIGRTGAARDTWTLCTPTIGAANTAVAALAAPGGVKINEWAGNHDYLLDDDFIELYNPAAQPVALGQMSLTDDFINYPARHLLPQLSFLAPGAFLRCNAKGGAATVGNSTELPFSIDASAGWLALIGQNGTIVDQVDVVAQPYDTSRGRTPNGGTTVATYGLPTNLPTPGASNAAPSANVLALVKSLRLSELLYTPGNLEYLELHNIGATTLDLSGVRFVKGVTYTFDAGATLAPGAYLVVCKDRAAFQTQFGGAVPLAARSFTGSLDNAGETIALQPPPPWDVNILNFAYKPSWFTPDTDNGYALTVINDTTTAARDWGEKTTWSPSPAIYGTPGANSAPTVVSALTASGLLGQLFTYQIVATKSPATYDAAPLPAGLSVNTGTGAITGTPTATGTFNVILSATNTTGTGTRILALTIGTPPPPTITSTGAASAVVGSPFTYQIVATSTPTSYDATGLPAGLSLNPATGLISGTPTVPGPFTVELSATNIIGTGTKTLTLTVTPPPPPVITSAGAASGIVGDVFNYQIIGSNSPATYAATGLPAELSVNPGTGFITGTPAAPGSHIVTLSATNAGGTGVKTLTVTVTLNGPLAAFAWSTIASPQISGAPFAATLRAVDAQGRTVPEFLGTANLTVPGATANATVGTGTGTWNFPFYTFYHDSRTQAIYLASELGGAKKITALALDVTAIPGQTMNNFTIRMKHTALASYATNAWEGPASGWTTVFQQIQTVSTTGWATFTFATPFNYDGTSNLMIDFSFNNSSYTSNGSSRSTTTTGNRSLTYYTDSGFGDPLTWNGTASPPPAAYAQIPNIKLTLEASTISITPVVSGNFANGVWSGNLTAASSGTGVILRADDGAGHAGNSNAFDVVVLPAPVITSLVGATAVIGGPFSYQILATNSPASFGAAGLPGVLAVNPATGLISGTPSTAGIFNVTLSATNAGGAGNRALALDVQTDADADGMGDAWEAANGLNNTLNDAADDLDGDGQSNIAEWLAGTAANDPASRLTASSQIVGADFAITWNSVVGKRYRLFTRTDLSAGGWTELTAAPVTAVAASTIFTHTGGASGGQRFYRVSIEP